MRKNHPFPSQVLAASSPQIAAQIGDAASTTLPLHPLAVAGLAGLAVNALALLPLGRTDGGRCALAAYGRPLAAGATALATLLLGINGITSNNDLLLFHLLYVFTLQRDLEIPSVDEITDIKTRRLLYAGALAFAILAILPTPYQPVVQATLPGGFPAI